MLKNKFLYAGVFLVSMSTLIYEILLTRILSILMYYNFVSVIIALALFGISLSSIYVYMRADKYPIEEIGNKIINLSKLFAFSVVSIFILILSFRLFPSTMEKLLALFQPIDIGAEQSLLINFVLVPAFVIAITIPFFISGMCITLILFHFAEEVSTLYFSDLIGAGLGCVLVIPLINFFGAPGALMSVATLILISTVCFLLWQNEKKDIFIVLTFIIIFFSITIANSKIKFVDIDFVHGKYANDLVYSDWDAFSRIAVYPLENETEEEDINFPKRMGISINETGYTAMVEFNNDFTKLDYLPKMINSLVWHIRSEKEVFLIGPGGGEDILASLYFKSKKVTAVEIDKLLVDIVNNKFANFSGKPYSLPRVKTYINNARSFIKTTDEIYDVINASLVYEWFHPTGGAFALSENHLYTKEAFVDYFNHLKQDGILSISRFSFEGRSLRLVALGLETLNELKINDPSKNIFIADEGGFATFLFKKTAFTKEELDALKSTCDNYKFSIIYSPLDVAPSPDNEIYFTLVKNSNNLETFYNSYPYDISAPTDDRPFFNYMVKPKDLIFSFGKIQIKEINEKTVYLLRSILGFSLLLVVIMVVFPRFFKQKTIESKKNILPMLIYFALIGFGFMLIEISVIRKFSLLMGNPLYSLSIVLFSILIFSGIGSFLTKKINKDNLIKWLTVSLSGIFLTIFILLNFSNISEPLFKMDFALRVIAIVLILAPLGVCLGMQLPMGIKILSEDRKNIPWVFSVNGAASVTGSIAAFIIAMNFGFNIVLVLAIGIYLTSGIIIYSYCKK